MYPNDVAPRVEDHVDVSRGSADAEAREVLAAALRESGNYGGAEIARGLSIDGGVGSGCGGGDGGEGVNSDGVAEEAELEE